jgi:hypothetical protein
MGGLARGGGLAAVRLWCWRWRKKSDGGGGVRLLLAGRQHRRRRERGSATDLKASQASWPPCMRQGRTRCRSRRRVAALARG